MKYLSAQDMLFLKRLGGLRLKSAAVAGGAHKSAQAGFGQEFVQHKQYSPGDGLRFLDWKVLARTDRFYVKQFHREFSLKTRIVIDASASMAGAKWDYACRLAMGAAFLLTGQGHSCGLAVCHGGGVELPAFGNTPESLGGFDAFLAGVSVQGQARLGGVLPGIFSASGRDCAYIVISDLLEGYDAAANAVAALKGSGNSVFAFQVLDRAEQTPPPGGFDAMADAESGDRLVFDSSAYAQAYRAEFERWQALCRGILHKRGVAALCFYTDEPPHSALRSMAMALAGGE